MLVNMIAVHVVEMAVMKIYPDSLKNREKFLAISD